MDKQEKIMLAVELSSETGKQIQELAKLFLWEENEALIKIIGAGIDYLLSQNIIDQKTDTEDKIISLTRELVKSEGRAAGAKYRLAEVKELIRRWELSSGSLQSLGSATEKIIIRQNNEHADLRKTITALEKENTKLRVELSKQRRHGFFKQINMKKVP